MVAVAFALGLGQLCAVGIHTLTWWLRRRALWLLAVGSIGVFAFSVCWLAAFDIGMDDSAPPPVPLDSYLGVIGALLLHVGLPACAIGLYHSFLLGRRWRWWLWPGTTLAAMGELTVAVWLCAFTPLSYHSLACEALLATLASLAVFRPLVLKFVRPVVPMVQRVTRYYLPAKAGHNVGETRA